MNEVTKDITSLVDKAYYPYESAWWAGASQSPDLVAEDEGTFFDWVLLHEEALDKFITSTEGAAKVIDFLTNDEVFQTIVDNAIEMTEEEVKEQIENVVKGIEAIEKMPLPPYKEFEDVDFNSLSEDDIELVDGEKNLAYLYLSDEQLQNFAERIVEDMKGGYFNRDGEVARRDGRRDLYACFNGDEEKMNMYAEKFDSLIHDAAADNPIDNIRENYEVLVTISPVLSVCLDNPYDSFELKVCLSEKEREDLEDFVERNLDLDKNNEYNDYEELPF